MKGNGGRSRSLRGAESPQRERDPFGLGLRRKSSPVVETPRRRSRSNAENVAPDAAANQNNIPDAPSPAPYKPPPSMKGLKTPAVAFKDILSAAGSPALMPKLPKPSPARGPLMTTQSHQGAFPLVLPQAPGPDPAANQGGGAKRKLNLDVQPGGGVVESLMNAAAAAAASADPSDTGVKVIVRMRPLNKKEAAEEATHVVQKVSANSLSLADQQFTYDAVAGENESQQAVFETVGLPMVENCLAGFNSSIFAYGQTGSGKTHTMWGPMPGSSTELMATEERGITPRVFEQLFARIQQEERNNVEKQLRYQCRCSFLEIYNEQITDLLEPSQKNLMIREDTKTGVYVEGLTEEYVSSMDDVTRLLVRGLANRRVGSTAMNNESSRSHSVFTFVIESRSKSVAEGASSVRTSRMNLVDLAGSERQKQTGAAGERLKEAGNINKSLSQLGNVINILAEVAQNGKHRHIPYRDSRLTFLLQESLGGNAKLAMICAISPASSCRTETLSTLRFAQRAKAMQNKAVVNEETANDVNLLREQIRQLKDELMRMKANSNPQEGGGAGGFANGWNARRSYNLLRLSLGQPMTIPPSEAKDNDKGLELDEEVHGDEPSDENGTDGNIASLIDTETKELLPKTVIGNAIESESEAKPVLACETEGESVRKLEGPAPSAPEFPELNLSLISPTLSVSPRVKEGKRKEPGADLPFGLPKSPLRSTLCNSKAFGSSAEQLAASLTRGIEILDHYQRNSLSNVRRSAGVRFSFQNGDLRSSLKSDATLRRLISSSNSPLAQEEDLLCSPEHENAPTTPPSPPPPMQPQSPAAGELSPWPQITLEDSCKIVATTPPAQKQHAQAIEVLLAGAMRREKVAEETIAQQAADIEQLNRLVGQYKRERECNAVLQQSREEKIARMECLMDGVLPPEEFRREEWAALQLEHQMLQEKFDQHPELAEAKAEQERLRHELQQLRSYGDLGERDALREEIVQLRNQLSLSLEPGTSGSLKQQHRLSLTPKKGVPPHSPNKLMSLSAVPEAAPSCESTTPSSSDLHYEDPSVSTVACERLEQERREWDAREKEWMSVVQELREECEHHLQLAEKRRKELEGEKRCSQEMHDTLQMAMTGHARFLDQYAELQEKHILLLAKMREIRDGVDDIKTVAKKSGLNSVEDRWFDVQATQIVFMKVQQDQYKAEIKALQAQLDDTADAVHAAGELLVRLKEAEHAAAIAKQAAAAAEHDASDLRRELEKSSRRHANEVVSLQQRLLKSGSSLQTPAPCATCGATGDAKSGGGIKGGDDVVPAEAADTNGDANATTTIAPCVGDATVPGVAESWSSSTGLSTCSDVKRDSRGLASVGVAAVEDNKSVLDSWSGGVEEDVDVEAATRESLMSSKNGYQYLQNVDTEFDDDEFLCESCAQPAKNGMRVCDACI